ncbi:type II secretion system protein [bacterium]|nr:type II secretion system protein [bacterium]
MKKNGFTLAETVITMAVIGVVAAISLPLINSFRIDENKVLFLRTYDAIVEATQMIISNSEMYPPIGHNEVLVDDNNVEEDKISYELVKSPLLNYTTKYKYKGYDYQGHNKFAYLLRLALGKPEDTEKKPVEVGLVNFDSKNGIHFSIDTTASFSKVESATFPDDIKDYCFYITKINIDVKDKENGCIYDKIKCPHPDQFLLYVTADGSVHAADPMGQYYLDTRSNLRLNKEVLGEKYTTLDEFNYSKIRWDSLTSVP